MRGIVPDYVRPSHAKSHGIRKGAGRYATYGTTCPSPVSRRGELSMGKVIDVYWSFAHAGDQYLGRLLAGFDPNSASFACYPPHFVVGMENRSVKTQ